MIVCEFAHTKAYLFGEDVRLAVQEVCQATEPALQELLPALPPRVELLMVTGTRVIPETGETGNAVTPRLIVWTIDPNRPEGVASIVRSRLRHTLFHEFHHLVRGWVSYGGEPPESFMHGVVCEGLATAFERDAAGSNPPWGQYPQDVESWVTELLSLPSSPSYKEWMLQHPDGRRWIGYRAGTFIADRAIQSSGLSAAKLAQVPTDDILRIAGVT
jgi:uncharacterized protein YjaZ